jgi:hypothetical protein
MVCLHRESKTQAQLLFLVHNSPKKQRNEAFSRTLDEKWDFQLKNPVVLHVQAKKTSEKW